MKLTVRYGAWLVVNLLFALPLCAQSSFQQEFNRQRQMMQDEFEDFRRKANMEYLNFLSQAWIEMGVEPEVIRSFKPIIEPVAPPQSAELSVRLENEIETLVSQEEASAAHALEAIESSRESVDVTGSSAVRFYGASLHYDSSGLSGVVPRSLKDEKMVAGLWREFVDSPLAGLLKQLLETKRQLVLNDWAFYLLVEQVSRSMFAPGHEDMITVFRHFLLVQFGYDVRMARQGEEIVLLVPLRQKVFARSFVKINAVCYYIYQQKRVAQASLLTYQIPAEKVKGDLLSLVYTSPLNLPADRMKECLVGEHTDCPVRVKLNSHLIDFYRDYPQMEVKNYAAVAADKAFTASLLKSLDGYLKGKTLDEQLSALLKWTQYGFEYIRDEVQFGREKPFFIEENFFYPGNDCEDRAILFSYLVWHLLGLDVALVEYGGHVATAVGIEGKGDYFLLQGRRFLVCDPTYMNAGVGQSMPRYKKEKATILLVSKLWRISK